jgi:hypothetical protein
MKTCPSCGADPGTVGVTAGHLCWTCLHREKIGAPLFASEQPRKITQLIAVGDQLLCLCNDGSVWKWDHTDAEDLIKRAPLRRWTLLPTPGAT